MIEHSGTMQTRSKAVQLFITCLIDSLFPEVGLATVEVLERVGVEVAFPSDQTCCGQPAFNAGFWDQAISMAQSTIRVLEATQGPIVIPSGSCAAMIKHGYLELFIDNPRWRMRAEKLSSRIFELSEYLVDHVGTVEMGCRYNAKFAYHPSCHLLRDLGVDRQPKALLAAISEAEVHHLEPECCGFGGVFAVDQPEISVEMLRRKMTKVKEAGSEVVVGCDVSCLMHIEGGFRRDGSSIRCSHITQVLTGKEPGLR